jgi:hypothetical protein
MSGGGRQAADARDRRAREPGARAGGPETGQGALARQGMTEACQPKAVGHHHQQKASANSAATIAARRAEVFRALRSEGCVQSVNCQ